MNILLVITRDCLTAPYIMCTTHFISQLIFGLKITFRTRISGLNMNTT